MIKYNFQQSENKQETEWNLPITTIDCQDYESGQKVALSLLAVNDKIQVVRMKQPGYIGCCFNRDFWQSSIAQIKEA